MNQHAVERTNPKGKGITFIGACVKCGVTGLTMEEAMTGLCAISSTQEEDILRVITPRANDMEHKP